jgi:hypothetical protein
MNPAIESKSVYHSILDQVEMNRSLGSVCVSDFSVSTIEASILIRANLLADSLCSGGIGQDRGGIYTKKRAKKFGQVIRKLTKQS